MSLCGTDDDKRTNEQVKIELLSRWKLEAEFRNTITNADSNTGDEMGQG